MKCGNHKNADMQIYGSVKISIQHPVKIYTNIIQHNTMGLKSANNTVTKFKLNV